MRQFVNANAPRDHSQVRGQIALSSELAEQGVVAGDDLNHHLGSQVFDIFGLQRRAALMGGMRNDVINQPQKAVHEIVPRTCLMSQAPLQEVAVEVARAPRANPRELRAIMPVRRKED